MSLRLLALGGGLALGTACHVWVPQSREQDEAIGSYCLLQDGVNLEVEFALEIVAQCMQERDAVCEATLVDGEVEVTGLLTYRAIDTYCSNTFSHFPTAVCPLPAGWEDATFLLDGAPYQPVSCNR